MIYVKYLRFIAVTFFIFLSCSNKFGTNYNYDYTVKVTYTNGDIDTLSCKRDSFKGNPVSVWIKITENGLLADAGTAPCLVVSCGFYDETVVCGVRKFEILNLKKIQIN